MPELIIAVVRANGEPPPEGVRAAFGADGGTIGRGSGSTLVLADPERLISRTHAVVELKDGRFLLRDQGSAIALAVNGRTLGNGHSVALARGDELTLGRYVLRVEVAETDDASDDTIERRSALAASEATGSGADLSMHGTLLSWSEDGKPMQVDAIRTVFVPSPPINADGEPLPAAAALERAPDAVPIPATAPDGSAGSEAPAASPAVELAPAPAASTPSPSDAIGPAAVPNESLTEAAFAIAVPVPTPPPEAPPVTAPAQDALLQALLEGAGVPRLAVPGGLTPELMRGVGQMLRETVQGLLDLLIARALTKRELRADATMIVASDNNPLKFSPSLEAALAHLLTPRGKGFMPPLRAVADANQSLRSHQLAFMAGMQAGLGSVFKRLDPKALEQRSGQPSFLGSLVPGSHKAHLWDQYVTLHAEVARDAESDFQSLFGREFLRAYQGQVNRMKQSPDDSPG